MAKPSTFGAAMTAAREAAGLTQAKIAGKLRKKPNTVYRWEKRRTMPSMEDRIVILQMLAAAPRPLLEALAAESGVSLASIGLAPPPPAASSHAGATAGALSATTQAMVDDAVREAAEEIDVAPKSLRPALSRMLDRLARGGVPIDAAARMVLGVPKKPEGK